MGFSVSLSHIIMVIGSIALASSFSAYALYTGSVVQSNVMQHVSESRWRMNLQLEIVYATVNETTTPSHFVIYAKNVGRIPLNNYTYLDVYVGKYGEAVLYSYDQNADYGSGKFKLVDANVDGVWEPRETAIIKVYPTSSPQGAMFEAKIVPFNGIGSSYLFAAPP